MIVNNEPAFVRAGQVIQSMLADVGITVTLQTVDGPTALSIMQSDQFEAALSTWSGRADPDANAYTYLGCKGGQNFGKYCNDKTEAALSEAAKVSDVAKRNALYTQAADQWMVDLPGHLRLPPQALLRPRPEPDRLHADSGRHHAGQGDDQVLSRHNRQKNDAAGTHGSPPLLDQGEEDGRRIVRRGAVGADVPRPARAALRQLAGALPDLRAARAAWAAERGRARRAQGPCHRLPDRAAARRHRRAPRLRPYPRDRRLRDLGARHDRRGQARLAVGRAAVASLQDRMLAPAGSPTVSASRRWC